MRLASLVEEKGNALMMVHVQHCSGSKFAISGDNLSFYEADHILASSCARFASYPTRYLKPLIEVNSQALRLIGVHY